MSYKFSKLLQWKYFIISFVFVFAIDQIIKWWIVLSGFFYEGPFISLVLVYNKGVAFSMFAFLKDWLKYIQIILLVGMFIYLLWQKELLQQNLIAFGIIFGAGLSNILDRFIHKGVVDYIFWHYKFEFAVFNLADVMIDIGVVMLLWHLFFKSK